MSVPIHGEKIIFVGKENEPYMAMWLIVEKIEFPTGELRDEIIQCQEDFDDVLRDYWLTAEPSISQQIACHGIVLHYWSKFCLKSKRSWNEERRSIGGRE